MPVFRNDTGEDRVVPTLGYVLVPAGDSITVPDDEAEHWDAAGGWTHLDNTPPAPVPAPAAAPVAAAVPRPAATAAAESAPVPAPSAPATSDEVPR